MNIDPFIFLGVLVIIILVVRAIDVGKQFTNINSIKGKLEYSIHNVILLQLFVGFLGVSGFILHIFKLHINYTYAIDFIVLTAVISEVAALTLYMVMKLKLAYHNSSEAQ